VWNKTKLQSEVVIIICSWKVVVGIYKICNNEMCEQEKYQICVKLANWSINEGRLNKIECAMCKLQVKNQQQQEPYACVHLNMGSQQKVKWLSFGYTYGKMMVSKIIIQFSRRYRRLPFNQCDLSASMNKKWMNERMQTENCSWPLADVSVLGWQNKRH
jgi:hypothetical protein